MKNSLQNCSTFSFRKIVQYISFLTLFLIAFSPYAQSQCEFENWYANFGNLPPNPHNPNQNITIDAPACVPSTNPIRSIGGSTINFYVRFSDWDVKDPDCLPAVQSQLYDAAYRIDFQVNNINFGGFDDGMGGFDDQISIFCHKLNTVINVDNNIIYWENLSPAVLHTFPAWVNDNLVVTATVNDISPSAVDPDVVHTFTLQPLNIQCPNNVERTTPNVEMADFESYVNGEKRFTYRLHPINLNYQGFVVNEEFIPYDDAILQEIELEFFTLDELKRRFKNTNNIRSMRSAVEAIFKIANPSTFSVLANNFFEDTHGAGMFQGTDVKLRKILLIVFDKTNKVRTLKDLLDLSFDKDSTVV